ncbi:MAG: hypothetical protein EOM80_09740 [Erysipelotrichia bacterium]|nr:hypothetical protein [Erysipelotrichia bacterium]
MEKILKAIIVAGLLFLPWQYYFWPGLQQVAIEKQQTANLKGSMSRLADGRGAMFQEILKVQLENIKKEKHRLEFLLPSFAKARANLMAPFDLLRTAIPGAWQVIPEGKFRISGPLVFWPFKLSFIGAASDAVKVLAQIETATQFMRLINFSIETREDEVELKGLVELVFQNSCELESDKGETR